MDKISLLNPSEQEAEKAIAAVYECIERRKNFRLEAGAGAGKTYSLIKALRRIINKQGAELVRKHQKVACITYTNVARDEIESRTDGHPAILSSTIHSFCWSLIKDFQPFLKEQVTTLNNWIERIEEAIGIGERRVVYELGYPTITDDSLCLSHNDVLSLTVKIMAEEKFRKLMTSHYPILFIDEYQDTNKEFAEALKVYFLDAEEGRPLIGLFGDHWQKIYGDGCGSIDHGALEVIGKKANFRSAKAVVDVLNRMRPELPQEVVDIEIQGEVSVYYTNEWAGTRRTGQHWGGDLPENEVHNYLEKLKKSLISKGWDLSPEHTKILMLTHNVLASEQGYINLAKVFRYNDQFIKKEDPHIAFLVDTLEPLCVAYEDKRYGEMFAIIGRRILRSKKDKEAWASFMDELLKLRSAATIGDVLDYLRNTHKTLLPADVKRREQKLEHLAKSPEEEKPSWVDSLKKLKDVNFQEVIALAKFIDGHTPFSTKHGVKGAEFENVIVVLGRGWNHYNFGQMLEWVECGIPTGKESTFERNRNLFYVVCSRPKKRLALLFTQELSHKALQTISKWFGDGNVHSILAD